MLPPVSQSGEIVWRGDVRSQKQPEIGRNDSGGRPNDKSGDCVTVGDRLFVAVGLGFANATISAVCCASHIQCRARKSNMYRCVLLEQLWSLPDIAISQAYIISIIHERGRRGALPLNRTNSRYWVSRKSSDSTHTHTHIQGGPKKPDCF